jgi:hypothetical protein
VSFREVIEEEYSAAPHGALKLTLLDKWGRELSAGFYYVAVTVGEERSIGKLLILK